MDARGLDQARRLAIGQRRRAATRAKVIAAAFDLFGGADGLHTRIEDIAAAAGVTRQTFYAHFTGMAALREAVTFELTHDFLVAVSRTIQSLEDPRERASAAIRFYLERTRQDPRWGWSMINLSANGVIFGAETHRQAEITVQEGMAAGQLIVATSAIGRDVVLGTTLAAMATLVREQPAASFPNQIAAAILIGLGVPRSEAGVIAERRLPPIVLDA